MKEQDLIKTKKDVLEFLDALEYYRGGMGNRISFYTIVDILKGKQRKYYKRVKKQWEKLSKGESC